ncbi:MAG: hypothetical protein QOJ13_1241 [Gaiellales bacterium]|jgi:hypothetical protein|nr:hypothetical protein [Gaiellales bacterium]
MGNVRWHLFDEHGALVKSYPDASGAVAALNALQPAAPAIVGRPMVVAVDDQNVRIPGEIHRRAA